jgi:hypothetical protein
LAGGVAAVEITAVPLNGMGEETSGVHLMSDVVTVEITAVPRKSRVHAPWDSHRAVQPDPG